MSRAALTDDTGRVVNVILVENDYEPPPGLRVHDLAEDSMVGPNWRLDDGEFVAPPALAPTTELPSPTGQWANAADARITALSAAVSALMGTVTLPDPDEGVLGELDPITGLPDMSGGLDLDDILSELEGL